MNQTARFSLRHSAIIVATFLFGTFFSTFFSAASAQELSADDILENLRASAETLTDATFLLTGQFVDRDGSSLDLEIDIALIRELNLVRAEFIQPDALADNFVIVDDQAVYNYLYLTNQVTILDASDPDALGGLITVDDAEIDFDLTTDLSRLFEGWEVTVLGHEAGATGSIYRLRFSNPELTGTVSSVEATVLEEEWIPLELIFYDESGSVFASLYFEDFTRDPGLNPTNLRFIPADAEVFDER